jgi:hypothetical protein
MASSTGDTGFKGTIKLDVRDSTPDWGAFTAKRPPEGAPNVLVVLFDDTGLAAWTPYGGRIFDVADDAYVAVERHMAAAMARD